MRCTNQNLSTSLFGGSHIDRSQSYLFCFLRAGPGEPPGSSWKGRARAPTSSQMPPMCMWETHCGLHQVVNNHNRKNREQERQEVRRDSTSHARE